LYLISFYLINIQLPKPGSSSIYESTSEDGDENEKAIFIKPYAK
jgi:hypothetical protein